jgi:predicted RNA-binding protein with RPS1 domain
MTRRAAAGNETPEQRWSKMIGESMDVRVIEVDRERRRLILSERMALQETRETLKDRLLDELQEGSVRKGRVTSLADFGAFVNIDGADGLVHLSEISWDRIQHPNEVLKVGQEVDVKVISVDRERKRIGLSIRQLQEDPWMRQVGHLKEGMLVEGKITHLTKFGAFARLEGDLEGLIHVSELSEQRIAHPKEVLHEGETITLRIIKIDPERHRIGLSRRKVDSPAYADLDWKMALAEEVGKASETEEVDTPVVESPVAEPVAVAEEHHGRGNLEYVEGIGPAYAEKLQAIGINTTDELLQAGASVSGRNELIEKTGISGSLILTWINHCDLFRINGVGSEYADLLEAAGVDTVVELAQRNAANLCEKLVAVNEEKNLVRKLPIQSDVEDWVEQAKDLPRIINY